MIAELTCPDCGTTRAVSRSRLSLVRLGKQSPRCHPCACAAIRAQTAARTEKRCGSCGETKPLVDFHRCRSHRDGRGSRCALCSTAAAKAYYLSHRASALVAAREWALANPDRRRAVAREHARRFRRAHPERARQRKDRTDFDTILQEHGMVCHICGDPIAEGDLHFDHVVPLSRGGAHSKDNIRPSHAGCNLSKGTKLMSELAA